jgi:hypothetical protein
MSNGSKQTVYARALKENRPGVTRKTTEWPIEAWAQLVIAAKIRNVPIAVLHRAIVIEWLLEHALEPPEVQPPIEVSRAAYEIASSPTDGNATMELPAKTVSERKLAEIFGYDS